MHTGVYVQRLDGAVATSLTCSPGEGCCGFAAGLGDSQAVKGLVTDARKPVFCSGALTAACSMSSISVVPACAQPKASVIT